MAEMAMDLDLDLELELEEQFQSMFSLHLLLLGVVNFVDSTTLFYNGSELVLILGLTLNGAILYSVLSLGDSVRKCNGGYSDWQGSTWDRH